MAACPKCASAVSDGASYCSVCGAPLSVANNTVVPPPPPQNGPAAAGLNSNAAGALAYLFGFITGIIFLVLEPYKRDKFVRFHAFQSIFLSVIVIVLGMLLSNVFVVGAVSFGFFWSLFALLWTLVRLAFFLLWLFLMYKAYNNESFKIPVIGEWAEKQAAK